jgi:tetratricopeptide (TPR) repeat protein
VAEAAEPYALAAQPINSMIRGVTLIVVALSTFTLTTGQIWQDKVSRKNAQGNEYYRKKDYGSALERYIEAQDGKNRREELSYNIANTFYQQKKYPEAVKELERSISTGKPDLNEKAYFNRGNSFYQMAQYQQAVESYEKALELDPRDRDAKYNLELALKKLHENPQQQKQNPSSKDQKQDSKENQQQKQQPDGQKQTGEQPEKKPGQQQEKQDETPKQGANPPKEQEAQQNPAGKGEQKQGMDPQEAVRILDAINNQEKREQRKQVLKVQREHVSGKDW